MATPANPGFVSAEVLQRLGLQRQPFPDSGDSDFVFFDAAHRTQLNVGLQLLQASERLLVLRGEPGMGKSAFLAGLAQRQPEGLRMCQVRADEYLEFEGLLGRFLRDTGLIDAGEELSVGLATARLSDAAREGVRPVLLLDDAQALSEPALERLLSVRRATVEEGSPFGLVLAVEPQFDTRLERLKQTVLSPELLHIINLFPFSERQSADYLTQSLATAGDTEGALLGEAQLRDAHGRSRGVPGALQREAVRLLTDRANGRLREPGARGRLNPRALALAGGIAVVLAGGAAVALQLLQRPDPKVDVPAAAAVKVPERYGFEDDSALPAERIMAAPPGVALTTPAEPAVEVAEAAVPAEPAARAEPKPEPTPAAPKEAAPGSAADPRAAQAQAPAERTASAPASRPEPARQAPRPEPVAAKPVAEKPVPAAKPAPAAPVARPTPTAQPVKTETAARPAARAADSDWLRGRNPAHFTVQLIGGYDRDAVVAFMEEHSLGAQAGLVRTQRDGKDWFVVVRGEYPSFKAAHGAVGELPEALRTTGPFVRKIGSLSVP